MQMFMGVCFDPCIFLGEKAARVWNNPHIVYCVCDQASCVQYLDQTDWNIQFKKLPQGNICYIKFGTNNFHWTESTGVHFSLNYWKA